MTHFFKMVVEDDVCGEHGALKHILCMCAHNPSTWGSSTRKVVIFEASLIYSATSKVYLEKSCLREASADTADRQHSPPLESPGWM